MSEILGDFKPNAKTVRDLFDGTSYYQIPDYQRPYAWGEDEIGQLWDDIYSAFEAKDEYYFLGPVILAQTGKSELEVVDGQQRLTTLTILFCVLRDFHLKESSDKNKALKKQIANAVKSIVDEKYRLTLITQAHYQNQFKQEILEKTILPQGSLTKKEKEKPKYKFMNAAVILKSRLDALNRRSGHSKIKELIQYILGNVVMITITCSSRVCAIKLFQTLNTRGLELDLADLTKSSLLSRVGTDKERKQFVTSWREIEKIAEDNDESVADLLTYYGYYLLGTKPRRALYEELESRFKNIDSNKVCYNLRKFADYYDEILSLKSKSIDSLKYLPDTVFWKTVLLTAKMSDFPRFAQLTEQLKRLYYSYWLANYTTAKTRDFSFNLVKTIKKGTPLSGIKKLIDEKMEDDDVFEWMKKDLGEDAYGYSWVKPLLILIERAQTDESVFIEYGRNLHIDHVLPEEWRKKKGWQRWWSDEEEADYWVNRLGNLTLLSGRKNIQASNEEFREKKRIYKGKGLDGTTGFEITKRIIDNTKWTAKQVKLRHNWMIREIKKNLQVSF